MELGEELVRRGQELQLHPVSRGVVVPPEELDDVHQEVQRRFLHGRPGRLKRDDVGVGAQHHALSFHSLEPAVEVVPAVDEIVHHHQLCELFHEEVEVGRRLAPYGPRGSHEFPERPHSRGFLLVPRLWGV